MLTYPMEERGSMPLYEYLYRRIRADILSGALREHDRLPSRRALAEHLRVSVITVEGAYRQLEAEGYVTSLERRGVFVNRVERLPGPPPRPDSGSLSGRESPSGRVPLSESSSLSDSIPPSESGSLSDAADARGDDGAPPVWKLDLASNRVDASRFPAATWARLVRQILSEGTDALLTPVPHRGLPALRDAIAADLREYRGLAVSAEQVVIGAGAEYLYLLLAQLLGRDTVLALEDPGYPAVRKVYETCGLRCPAIPLDRQGMDPDALTRSAASAAHISPSHQYPTGIVTPIGRRQELLRWSEATGGVLIEDDYDSEFRFTGRPIPALQSIDAGGRVVYMNTFSQTISPAMRMGYMVLPPALLETYRRKLDFYACTVPALEQHVLCRFIRGGFYEQHLFRMRKEYRARRAAVLDAFRQGPFAGRVTISEQGAGLHFLLRLDTREDDETIRRRGAAHGVRLRFLSAFASVPNPDFAHTLVVNYAHLSPERLPEAVELLGKTLFP